MRDSLILRLVLLLIILLLLLWWIRGAMGRRIINEDVISHARSHPAPTQFAKFVDSSVDRMDDPVNRAGNRFDSGCD